MLSDNGTLRLKPKPTAILALLLLLALGLRQLTFLAFNPLVDPRLSTSYNNYNIDRHQPVRPFNDFNASHFGLESAYPIVSSSIIQSGSSQNYAEYSSQSKLVLLWTDFFAAKDWYLGKNVTSGIYHVNTTTCPVANCYITRDRSMLSQVSAVVFHYRNFLRDDWPPFRPPNQYWIFTMLESPDHTYSGNHITSRTSKPLLATDYNSFFNWTMTYRFDSDIPMFYGHFKRRKSSDIISMSQSSSFFKKTRTAVIMTSHCDTSSHRLEYVRELQRYIDVDVVGRCADSQSSHLADPHCLSKETPDECHKFLSNTYKFYLAFENSCCGDYVTEKFFRAASLDLVPVVLNGAVNMSKFAPPNSYINAANFESPRHLARHLELVAQNKQLYDAHFWWKRFYDVDFGSNKEMALCDVCGKLIAEGQDPVQSRKIYKDLDTWWMEGNGQCRPGTVLLNQSLRTLLDRISFLLMACLVIIGITRLTAKIRQLYSGH